MFAFDSKFQNPNPNRERLPGAKEQR